jgi:SAM-dependent methyltransferase
MNHLQQSIHQAARRSARKAYLTARYGGLRYQCPCCRSRFRRFAPHGTPPRPNRACPNCRALVRHRLLWLYLSRELHVASRSYRVLHIAPERAMRRRLASAPNLTYVTADLNMPEAPVRAQLDSLPFGNACFDVVICSHVLEHVEKDLESMAELHRVLARTGPALIMVPVNRKLAETYEDPSITDPEARKRAFGHPGHLRYYGADVTARLEESGFEVEPVDYADRLPPREAERINAPPGELIYVCSR